MGKAVVYSVYVVIRKRYSTAKTVVVFPDGKRRDISRLITLGKVTMDLVAIGSTIASNC